MIQHASGGEQSKGSRGGDCQSFKKSPQPTVGIEIELPILDRDSGEVMPQKSTFFYPKIASGMVFNPIAVDDVL